jgi:hypothetical protein
MSLEMGDRDDADYRLALRRELDRRLHVIDGYDERTFRCLSERELLVAGLVTVVLPILVVWAFA